MTASVRAVKERPQPPLQPGDRQVARPLQQKTARAKRDIREMPSSHSMRFDSDPNPGGLRGGILRQLAKSRVTGPLNVLSPCRPVCVSRSRRDAERGPLAQGRALRGQGGSCRPSRVGRARARPAPQLAGPRAGSAPGRHRDLSESSRGSVPCCVLCIFWSFSQGGAFLGAGLLSTAITDTSQDIRCTPRGL